MGIVTKIAVLAILAGALAPGVAESKNCRKGKPCGNSCIARSKTCRIGTPSQRAPSPAAYAGERSAPPPRPSAAGTAEPVVWIGLRANRHAYRADCPMLRDFDADQRVYFDTRAAALAAGYSVAAGNGCP
jgi:hypothetical protein